MPGWVTGRGQAALSPRTLDSDRQGAARLVGILGLIADHHDRPDLRGDTQAARYKGRRA